MVCAAGSEAKADNQGSVTCQLCEKGSFKEVEGIELCSSCNENLTTISTGAVRASECNQRK